MRDNIKGGENLNTESIIFQNLQQQYSPNFIQPLCEELFNTVLNKMWETDLIVENSVDTVERIVEMQFLPCRKSGKSCG